MEISDRSEENSWQQLEVHKTNVVPESSSNNQETSKRQAKKAQRQQKKGDHKEQEENETKSHKNKEHKDKGKGNKDKGNKEKGDKGKEKKDKEHKGKEHKDKEHKGKEHKGKEHKDKEHKEKEHKEKEHKGKGPKEINVTALNQIYAGLTSRLQHMSKEISSVAETRGVNLAPVASVPVHAYNMKLTPENVHTLENKLNQSIRRLLHLGVLIKNRADECNISLPQQELVDQLSSEIAKEFEEEQVNLNQRLERLLEQASMLSGHPVEPDRPKVIKHHSKRSSLLELPSDAKIEPFDHYPSEQEQPVLESMEEKETKHTEELPSRHRKTPSVKITSALETEKHIQDMRLRKKSLQIGVSQLRNILSELGLETSVDSALLTVALQQMNVFNETADKSSLPAYMESVISSVSDESGQINHHQLCDYLNEPTLTRPLPNSQQWNEFRQSLIGRMRMSNHLRIHYWLDGWPRDKTIELDNFNQLTEVMNNNSQVELSHLLPHIQNAVGKEIDYGEYRIKTGPTAEWEHPSKSSQTVPVSFAKDGWAQLFVWLRTRSFIAKKGGIPFE